MPLRVSNLKSMNIINKSIQKIHRYTGLAIALFFMMWVMSGVVLLYHKYPKVSQEDLYSHMEKISIDSLPSIYDLPGMTDSTKVKTLSIGRFLGQNVWTISSGSGKSDNKMSPRTFASDQKYVLAGDSLISQQKITSVQRDSIACLWAGCDDIIKTDTLRERQQWVLYDRFEKSLPILRYYFDNPEHSEIFISEKDGEVVQATTRQQRIPAWLGAIPHKLYFKGLRTDTDRWKNIITILAMICLAAALSGMYIGIYYLVVNKRKHDSLSSPFKKRLWRYHHIAGLIFGVFLIGWGVSGCFSTQRVPKWMVNYDGDYSVSASKFWGKTPLKLKDYKLDYRDVLTAYPDVKSISWQHFGQTPAYLVVSGIEEIYVDASEPGQVRRLEIAENEIENAVMNYFGDDCKYSLKRMTEYDEYYLSAKGKYPLPVWKIEIEDADGSRLYVSPSDGYIKYLNKNRMAKKWLFSAAHYLDIKYFMMHKSLRLTCIWILALGGAFVIVTGVAIYIIKQ